MPAGKKIEPTRYGSPLGIPAANTETRPVQTNPLPVPYGNTSVPARDDPSDTEAASSSGGFGDLVDSISTALIAGIVMLLVAALMAVGRLPPLVVLFVFIVGAVLIVRGCVESRDDEEGYEIDLEDNVAAYGSLNPILAGEVAYYSRRGYRVVSQTPAGVHLIRPKRFSFWWAFLWLLFFGFGLIVYLLYYASKRDESIYLRIRRDGRVLAHHGHS